MLKTLLEDIQTIKASMDCYVQDAQDAFKAKEKHSLDSRWNLFIELTKMGILPTETYGDGHVDVFSNNASPYDDLYVERHETQSYQSTLELIEERIEEEDSNYPADKLDDWKEAVLAAGYGSWTFDW